MAFFVQFSTVVCFDQTLHVGWCPHFLDVLVLQFSTID